MTTELGAAGGYRGSGFASMTLGEQDSILPSGTEVDLDLFRDRLNSAYYPAFVDTIGHKAVLKNGRLNAKILNRMTIGFVRFGHEAIVDPGRIDAYHVNVPVVGTISSRWGTRRCWRAQELPRCSPRTVRRGCRD